MKGLRLLIKLLKPSRWLVAMFVNAFAILVIACVGLFTKWNDTIILLFLNLIQIVLFIKVNREVKERNKAFKKEIEKFDLQIMALLIVDNNFQRNIKKLVDFARENPLSMDDLLDIYNGAMKVVGDTEGYYFVTPTGIKIVHCIEQQVAGEVRYLSVSVPSDGSLPNPYLIMQIMEEVGFENKMEDCILDLEGHDKDNRTAKAIAIREIIKNGQRTD